jgi:uncharacterized phage protein (TIGR02220 family)
MASLCPHCHQVMPTDPKVGDQSTIIEAVSKASGRKYRVGGANARSINARFQEGYYLKDFLTVIEYMRQKWSGDPTMQKYIRPSTLFRASHFGEYLAEAEQYDEECKGRARVRVPASADAHKKPLTDEENLDRLQALKQSIGDSNGYTK